MRPYLPLCLVLLLCEASSAAPEEAPAKVDPSTLTGKVMCGYQGWFNCAGDGADLESATARLTQTSVAQPALFVVSYALAQQWRAWGIEPDVLIGHSIGAE